MWMLGTGIYIQVAKQLTAKLILWKHALYRLLYDVLWLALQCFSCRTAALSTGISSVPDVVFLFPLVSAQLHGIRVDDDHIVSTISMWSEVGLVLTAQHISHNRRKTTQCLILGVYHYPLLVCRLGIG